MSAEIQAELPRPSWIALAYDAAIQPDRWKDFVEAASHACGGRPVSLLLSVSGRHDGVSTVGVGVDAEFERRFWLETTRSHSPRGAAGHVRSHEHPGLLRVLAAASGGHSAATAATTHTALVVPFECSRGGLAIFPGLGVQLSARTLESLEALAPHLERAVEIHRSIQRERARESALRSVLDRWPDGVIFATPEGRVVLANAAARRIASRERELAFRGGRVSLRDGNRERELAAAMRRVGRGECPASALRVATDGMSRPLTISVTRVSSPPDPMVALHLCSAGETVDPELLRRRFSLTRAEAGLASLLASGRSLARCAELRGIGIGTARGYLKALYRKTRTHSQRELTHRILESPAAIVRRDLEQVIAYRR